MHSKPLRPGVLYFIEYDCCSFKSILRYYVGLISDSSYTIIPVAILLISKKNLPAGRALTRSSLEQEI